MEIHPSHWGLDSVIEWLQFVGALVAILLAVIKLHNQVRKCITWIVIRFGNMKKKIINKLNWILLRPTYETRFNDALEVDYDRVSHKYRLQLPVVVKLHNKSGLDILDYSFDNIKVELKSKRYKLHRVTYRMGYDPATSKTKQSPINIAPNHSDEISIMLKGVYNVEPVFGDKAKCKFNNIGVASMSGVVGQLKISNLKLKVKQVEGENNATP